MTQLPDGGGNELLFAYAAPHMGIEVAVRAFRLAVRPVHIDRQRPGMRLFRAFNRLRT